MSTASIIIPCYNLGAYLEESLASALAQTYQDYEVILIDDGSTDPATIALLDRLPRNPRLRVIRSQNQGVARARNYAIAQAQGQYILPLDADDRILPTYLEQAVAILETDSDIAFVGCHYRTFGERKAEYCPKAYQLPDLLIENVVPVASVYRRTCWEQAGGYCPELNSIEDWDLWISFLGRGYRAEVIPEILFEYRIRPNSNLSYLRDPVTNQARMAMLYKRHQALFQRYNTEVLLGKDRVFTDLHAYAMWQEQQARNWERVAEERQQVIEQLGSRAEHALQRHIWLRRQADRVQQVTAGHSGVLRKGWAVGRGVARVLRRKAQHMLALLGARVRK